MIKTFGIAVWFLLPLFFVYPVWVQDPAAKGEIFGEGVVVAFQKKNRYPEKPYSRGIATFVEYWIVRIDKWAEGTSRDQQYILVQFNLHERGVSDSEINSGKLRFRLRERRDDEHTNCLGRVFLSGNRSGRTGQAQLSDYQRTKVGGTDHIPSLKSLPCFIADYPPVVIENKK